MEQKNINIKKFIADKFILLAVAFLFGFSYAYAWTAPTAAPLDSNIVVAPLNTGTTSQTKAGTLEVGSMAVTGGIKIGNSAVICSELNKGSIRYNETRKKLEYCNAFSWKTFAEVATTPVINSFTASESVTRTNTPFTLSWFTTAALSCTASGSWSGSKTVSNSQNISEASAGNKLYTLTCSNVVGSASSTVAVEVRFPVGTILGNYSYVIPTRPYGIAFDGTNMWSANSGNNSVSKITPAGSIIPYTGTGAGPRGIAFDNTNMWTANTAANSVTKVSPTGGMVTYTGTGATPYNLAFDNTNMWTANSGNNSVTKISPTGTMSTYIGTGAAPYSIAFDNTNMWTANYTGNSVTKVSPTGAMTTYSGTGANPVDIAFDGTNMWTVNYTGNSVTKISPTGVMTTYTGAGTGPYSIAFDGTNMWTANSGSNNFSKISPEGVVTTYSGGATMLRPYGIAFNNVTKNIWTANWLNNTVSKVQAI